MNRPVDSVQRQQKKCFSRFPKIAMRCMCLLLSFSNPWSCDDGQKCMVVLTAAAFCVICVCAVATTITKKQIKHHLQKSSVNCDSQHINIIRKAFDG